MVIRSIWSEFFEEAALFHSLPELFEDVASIEGFEGKVGRGHWLDLFIN
jgi:hypothetical protein